MRRTVPFLPCLLALLCGCGTVVPGARYRVNVDDYAFSHDGTGVFYLEDRLRFYPFLLASREDWVLYRYDRESRRHRLVAETGAFSVSPHSPLVLCAPDWRRRFDGRGTVPDFQLLDAARGTRRGFSMPEGFDNGYLTYAFAHVEWSREGPATAWIHFYYLPGARPSPWRWCGRPRHDWRRELWRVVVDPAREDGAVADASPRPAQGLPRAVWRDMRDGKAVSSDGAAELLYTRYVGRMRFNTTLAVAPAGGGEREYVVREHALLNWGQAGYYTLLYVLSAPVFGVNSLLRCAGVIAS